jgi:hypothetical protein
MVPVELVSWKPFWAISEVAPFPMTVTPLMSRSARLKLVAFFWKSVIEPPIIENVRRVSLSTTRPTPRWTPFNTGSRTWAMSTSTRPPEALR